jgi:hypothetical protein
LTATPTLKLVAVIVPLGLDTLGVALALGVAGVSPRRRLRIALLFASFEAAMPLIGVALGAPLGRSIGAAADYGAAALLRRGVCHPLLVYAVPRQGTRATAPWRLPRVRRNRCVDYDPGR